MHRVITSSACALSFATLSICSSAGAQTPEENRSLEVGLLTGWGFPVADEAYKDMHIDGPELGVWAGARSVRGDFFGVAVSFGQVTQRYFEEPIVPLQYRTLESGKAIDIWSYTVNGRFRLVGISERANAFALLAFGGYRATPPLDIEVRTDDQETITDIRLETPEPYGGIVVSGGLGLELHHGGGASTFVQARYAHERDWRFSTTDTSVKHHAGRLLIEVGVSTTLD